MAPGRSAIFCHAPGLLVGFGVWGLGFRPCLGGSGLQSGLRAVGPLCGAGELTEGQEKELAKKLSFVNPAAAPFAGKSLLDKLMKEREAPLPLLDLLMALEVYNADGDVARSHLDSYLTSLRASTRQCFLRSLRVGQPCPLGLLPIRGSHWFVSRSSCSIAAVARKQCCKSNADIPARPAGKSHILCFSWCCTVWRWTSCMPRVCLVAVSSVGYELSCVLAGSLCSHMRKTRVVMTVEWRSCCCVNCRDCPSLKLPSTASRRWSRCLRATRRPADCPLCVVLCILSAPAC